MWTKLIYVTLLSAIHHCHLLSPDGYVIYTLNGPLVSFRVWQWSSAFCWSTKPHSGVSGGLGHSFTQLTSPLSMEDVQEWPNMLRLFVCIKVTQQLFQLSSYLIEVSSYIFIKVLTAIWRFPYSTVNSWTVTCLAWGFLKWPRRDLSHLRTRQTLLPGGQTNSCQPML